MDPTTLLKILNDLYGPFTARQSESKANLVAAEKRIGTRLPKLLRDYYLLAGKAESLNQSHNHLLPLDALLVEDKALVFYVENQAEVVWAILSRDLGMTDPPVYRAENGEDDLVWHLDHRFFSDFLITMACWQAVAGGLAYSAVATVDQQVVETIRMHWQVILPAENTWGLTIHSRGGQVLVLLEDAQEGMTLLAAGRTAEDFAAIDSIVHLVWQERTTPAGEDQP